MLGRALRVAVSRAPSRALPLLSSQPTALVAARRLSQAVQPAPAEEAEAPTASAAAAAASAPEPEAATAASGEAAAGAGSASAPAAAPRVSPAPEEPKPPSKNALSGQVFLAAKEKRYKEVLALFDELTPLLVEQKLTPDPPIVHALLEAKAMTESAAAALQAQQLMMQQFPTVQADASHYEAIMRCCISGGDTATARQLYDAMLATGKPANVEVYNTLVQVYTAAKDFVAAEHLFTEMREQGVKPMRMTYLRYINGCFKGAEPERAYAMLVTMENEWRVPSGEDYERMFQNFVRYNHAAGRDLCIEGMKASPSFGKGGKKGGGEALAGDVLSAKLPEMMRDALEYVRSQPEAVLSVYEAARGAGLRLPRHEMHGVIFAHIEMKEPIKAFKHLLDIIDAGHAPVPRIVEMVGEELCAEASLVDEAYYVLEERRNEGAKVPLQALNLVIEACAQLEDLDRAFATWSELEAFGLQPDVGTFNALLHTCGQHGQEMAVVARASTRTWTWTWGRRPVRSPRAALQAAWERL